MWNFSCPSVEAAHFVMRGLLEILWEYGHSQQLQVTYNAQVYPEVTPPFQ